jgi:pantetheine-phosphate adenylyltransferase
MKTKAVYAGSFDPFTMGHLWVFLRAASLFDEIVIAVGQNPNKQHTFTTEKRVEMIQKTLELFPSDSVGNFHGAQVTSFDGNVFLVNYARENGFTHIVRGLRDQDDFRDEKRFLNMGLAIQHKVWSDRPIVDTVYIMTPPDMEVTSSSGVKAMCGPQEWELVVNQMVPTPVFKELQAWVAAGKSQGVELAPPVKICDNCVRS